MGAGGDLNDIKSRDKKNGGKIRQETSFQSFRTFINEMEMTDIVYRGETSHGLPIEMGRLYSGNVR